MKRSNPIDRTGYLNAEGVAVIAPEVPVTPKKRKDSLAKLIGASPIGAKGLDSVETVEDAMLAKYVLDLGRNITVSLSAPITAPMIRELNFIRSGTLFTCSLFLKTSKRVCGS